MQVDFVIRLLFKSQFLITLMSLNNFHNKTGALSL